MCSGEYCATHFVAPCDCDVIERHLTCLVANKVERPAGADALPVGELASVPACIPAGERDSE